MTSRHTLPLPGLVWGPRPERRQPRSAEPAERWRARWQALRDRL